MQEDACLWDYKECRASAGCKLSQCNHPDDFGQIRECLAASELDGKYQTEPVKVHHKFRTAAAGCPNSCSEPQIRDFSIVAGTRPQMTGEACIQCGACVRVCPDKAITLTENPFIDTEKCLDCGLCIKACPSGTITEGKKGVKVFVGGRLGRKPCLARKLTDLVSLNEALGILEACVTYYLKERNPGERFSSVLERLGIQKLMQQIEQQNHDK